MPYLASFSRCVYVMFALLTLSFGASQAYAQAEIQFSSKTKVSDAQIVAIAKVLNQGEVTTSEPAVNKASSDKVKQFAQRMVNEHKQALQKLETLAQQTSLSAESSEISNTLEDTAQGVKQTLMKLNGAEFDNKYMEMQLSLHQSALNLLDYTLIPRTQNDQLREQLINMRMVVDQHLTQAREIYKGL